MKTDTPTLFFRLLLVILCLITIYIFILLVFGNTPTVTDFLMVLVSALTVYTVQTNFQRGKFEGKVLASFSHIKEDLTELKQRMSRLEEKNRWKRE